MILTSEQFTEGRPFNKVFITSDFHLSHSNIIKYAKRPYKDSEEMNEAILKKFDELPDGSLIWNLGDFSFNRKASFLKPILERLNSKGKVHNLIMGNHDKENLNFYKGLGFGTVLEGPVLVGQLLFTHCPYYLTGKEKVINIHGHTHERDVHPNYFKSDFYEGPGKGNQVYSKLYFNASIDKQPYISLEELEEKFKWISNL